MTPRPDLPQPHLSGLIVKARSEYLSRVHGSEALRRVLQALPPEERARLLSVKREAFYPFATLVALDRTMASLLPEGESVYDRLGEYAARLRNDWLGEHTALVSPHAYLARLAEGTWRLQTFGHTRYSRISFGEGEIAYSEYPQVDPVFCRSARAFLRASVEQLVGEGAVSVEETRCQCRGDDACVFAIKWTPSQEP